MAVPSPSTAYAPPVDPAGPLLNGASYGGGAGPSERTDPPIKSPAERRAAAERLRKLWNIKEQ